MVLNFDLHVHSFFSSDGVAAPEAIVASARAKGLSGIAITDHNTCECVDYFMAHGFMNKAGTPVDGFLIIPGQEVTTAEGHLLCLGGVLPNLKGMSAAEVVKLIHAQGALAVPPHPYDLVRAGIRRTVLDALDIDALEVFNAATTLRRYNKQAFDYAKERGLPMTAASDAHHESAVGTAFTILDTEDFTMRGVLDQIIRSNTLSQRYLTPSDSFKKTWSNWLRLKRRKPACLPKPAK